MDVFQLLKKDHEKVAELFKQIEDREDDLESREKLFLELKSEVEAHSKAEEAVFYPALEDQEETKEIILEAHEEHKVVATLLEELADTSLDDETWSAKLTVLKENIEHHVEEEEGEIFKKARKLLDEVEIDRLGQRVANQKVALKGRLSPLEFEEEEDESIPPKPARRAAPAKKAKRKPVVRSTSGSKTTSIGKKRTGTPSKKARPKTA